jgi:hypothetical protein
MSNRTTGIASGTDMILEENQNIQKKYQEENNHEKSLDCLLPSFTRQKDRRYKRI